MRFQLPQNQFLPVQGIGLIGCNQIRIYIERETSGGTVLPVVLERTTMNGCQTCPALQRCVVEYLEVLAFLNSLRPMCFFKNSFTDPSCVWQWFARQTFSEAARHALEYHQERGVPKWGTLAPFSGGKLGHNLCVNLLRQLLRNFANHLSRCCTM